MVQANSGGVCDLYGVCTVDICGFALFWLRDLLLTVSRCPEYCLMGFVLNHYNFGLVLS